MCNVEGRSSFLVGRGWRLSFVAFAVVVGDNWSQI